VPLGVEGAPARARGKGLVRHHGDNIYDKSRRHLRQITTAIATDHDDDLCQLMTIYDNFRQWPQHIMTIYDNYDNEYNNLWRDVTSYDNDYDNS
jgi:hypothetical protein